MHSQHKWCCTALFRLCLLVCLPLLVFEYTQSPLACFRTACGLLQFNPACVYSLARFLSSSKQGSAPDSPLALAPLCHCLLSNSTRGSVQHSRLLGFEKHATQCSVIPLVFARLLFEFLSNSTQGSALHSVFVRLLAYPCSFGTPHKVVSALRCRLLSNVARGSAVHFRLCLLARSLIALEQHAKCCTALPRVLLESKQGHTKNNHTQAGLACSTLWLSR